MTTRTRAVTAAALLTGALAFGLATPGLADSPEDGLWYYDLYEFDAIHKDGIDGSGVTIAVIDSPVYTDLPTLEGANVTTDQVDCTLSTTVSTISELPPAESDDPAVAHHGTNVTAIIAGTGDGYSGQLGVPGIAPGAKVHTYAASVDEYRTGDVFACEGAGGGQSVLDPIAVAIRQAVDDGANIVSISLDASESQEMVDALTYAYQHDAIVVSGLPNQESAEQSIEKGPANLNGVVSVTRVGAGGEVQVNYAGDPLATPNVDVAAPGVRMLTQGSVTDPWTQQKFSDGTSYATPFVAAMLALGMQKYPDATTNQLLQSLIHNTGLETHDPSFDESFQLGYGIVDPITFLADDPTGYPDENPFLEAQPRNEETFPWGPTIDEVAGTPTSSATASAGPGDSATPSPDASGSPDDASSEGPSVALVLLIGGIIVLVVVGVVVGVIVSRRSKEDPNGRS